MSAGTPTKLDPWSRISWPAEEHAHEQPHTAVPEAVAETPRHAMDPFPEGKPLGPPRRCLASQPRSVVRSANMGVPKYQVNAVTTRWRVVAPGPPQYLRSEIRTERREISPLFARYRVNCIPGWFDDVACVQHDSVLVTLGVLGEARIG